jgi:hypothetical protein
MGKIVRFENQVFGFDRIKTVYMVEKNYTNPRLV